MKILIVDDHKEDRYMLEVLLRGQGYEVISAGDGVEALEKALHDNFDMIIADILMPRMDGLRLCREVKTNEKLKKLAFVFYTATYTDPKDEEFALSLGAESFIVKPTEPDILAEILKKVIRSHERGTLGAPKPPVEEEAVYLKEYNERLIKKLEDKMLQLESVNKVLGESEKKYRDLIDNANDAVIVVERTGDITFVNPKFCEMTGYSIDEAKKLHFRKLVHPDDLDMVTEYFRKRVAGEKVPVDYEARLLTRAGKLIYIDNNTSPIKKGGKIIGVLTIMRDTTERKRAEEELRESKQRLELALRGADLGLWDWNVQTGEVVFNERWAEMLGYSLKEIEPHVRTWEKLVHPDDMPGVTEVLNAHLEGKTPFYENEHRLLTKSGEWKWILDRGRVLEWDKDGKPLRAAGTHLDITEHKRAEEEKAKIQTQLLQAQKIEAIGTLAGGVAHDFNNLLTTIQGYTDLAMIKVDETDPLYRDLKQVRLAAGRAADLTRQLLLFSRKQPMELTPLNINWTVDDLLKMLNRLIGEDIAINTDMEPDLWTVRADKGNIEQVIMNLAVNARDAMPGGGELTIKTENVILDDEQHCKVIPEARPGKFACLSVADTGVGMDQKIIPHIFEPFFSTKEIGKGTGLGLSVVYGIVKLGFGISK